jgi:hypothetical protein
VTLQHTGSGASPKGFLKSTGGKKAQKNHKLPFFAFLVQTLIIK